MSRFIKLKNITINIDEVDSVYLCERKKSLYIYSKKGFRNLIKYKYRREVCYAYNFVLSKLNVDETTLDDFIFAEVKKA